MSSPVSLGRFASIATAVLAWITTSSAAPESDISTAASSSEQGQTSLDESFDSRQSPPAPRGEAWRDITYKFNLRTYYLDRHQFDGSENEAWAAGGWAGLKTGYFLDHISLGLTGCTSQHLQGDEETDGTLLLAPGQQSYSVLGELYADIRLVDGLNLAAGRKEYDTPFINRNDTRMTPNTFEAVALQGLADLGGDGATFKYGVGYFDRIKERNSDEFVSMSVDAGATVERGVFTAGGLYQKGNFSFGGIDYYSEDIINIGYLAAKLEVPLRDEWKLILSVQYADQRGTGDDLLYGREFSARQFGFKAELPVGQALFTTAITSASGDTNMQSPWSGYPGYTSSQVQDFNRDGESALLLRAGYEFTGIKGLDAYAQGVFGTAPDEPGQYRQDEYDLNLQWAPSAEAMEGFTVRLRYAIVEQHGGDAETLTDFRVICNYTVNF